MAKTLACAGLAALCANLAACASRPEPPPASVTVQKVGKPYQVRGRWYAPAHQPDYDEVGEASWYGAAHQGKPTASGEVFDLRRISGAHKTLPLPSVVEVINLDNGRSLRVRINDRGPFARGRILDVSEAAAEKLGFKTQGVARVRVRYIDQGSSPAAAPPRSQARRAEAPTHHNAKFMVQAAAFADPENARRAAEVLEAVGRTSIRSVDSDGRALHRTLIGPWPDRSGAETAKRKAAALGFGDARVIPVS